MVKAYFQNMIRSLSKILLMFALVSAGAFGVWRYYENTSSSREIARLESDKKQLQEIVTRLGSEKRIADVLVTSQKIIDGKPHTTLLFVEKSRAGNGLAPKSFTVIGKMLHVDALVVKFEHDLIQKNDPLRGHSLALFSKVYGDGQKPEEGFDVDPSGTIPDIYRGADARVSTFERELWSNIWKLLEDESYRREKGVRVAQGEGVWWPPVVGQLYTLTIETDGGINLASKPVEPIYQELLRSLKGSER